MSQPESILVHGRGGLTGRLDDPESLRSGDAEAPVLIHLDDGRELLVPAGILQTRMDGSYDLPLSDEDLPEPGPGEAGAEDDADDSGGETFVLPVVRERAVVRRRRVPTGRVRIVKTVRSREQEIAVPLAREEVHVERVAVNRPVDAPVPVRHEGDTTIIPLLEEVLVVEKRLVLREELHVTRRRVTALHEERVALRSEEAEVQRSDARGDGDATPAPPDGA